MKKLPVLFLILYYAGLITNGQSFRVITVPYTSFSTSIPHPAYNGHPTTFKAIARSSNPAQEFYYRWDIDGDGDWDNLGPPPIIPTGMWYRSNCYSLDGKALLPYVDPSVATKKIFIATIEVAESVNVNNGIPVNSQVGAYPITVFANVPAQTGPDINTDNATNEQLEVMRSVALDDALWFLHCELSRWGSGAQITGYFPQSYSQYSLSTSSMFLLTLAQNGRIAAYPVGTYNDFGASPPAIFLEQNNLRWNIDPYAEDAARILNYLLENLQFASVTESDEANDGKTPISGTDDRIGHYFPVTEMNERSFALAALSLSGLGSSKAQTGNSTYVSGKNIEFIVQQIIDYIVFSQIKSGQDLGGWYYTPGSAASASYITGGTINSLKYAEQGMNRFGVIIPEAVKGRVASIIVSSQNADGGVGWSKGMTSILEPAGLFLGGTGWLGWNQFSSSDNTSLGNPYISLTRAQAKAVYNKYQLFIANNWQYAYSGDAGVGNLFGLWTDGNYNSGSKTHSYFYSIYNTAEGAKSIEPQLFYFVNSTGSQYDWRRQFMADYIKGQYSDGSFGSAGSNYWLSGTLFPVVYGSTVFAANTITPRISDPDPVAIGLAAPMVTSAGCTGTANGKVTFNHSFSYSVSPVRQIVDYQWAFEVHDPANPSIFNSVNWASIPNNSFSPDGKYFHTNSRDFTPVYQYILPGTYHAALRVIDNSIPSKTNIFVIKNITVTTPSPLPPSANHGGPYQISLGQSLTLSGTVTDPNLSCYPDVTSSQAWDLDNDGFFDDFLSASGSIPWAAISSLNLAVNTANVISLKVTNSLGMVGTTNTSLIVCDIQVDLGGDFEISSEETATLDAGTGSASYLWNDGSTLQQLIIDGSTMGAGKFKYWVRKTSFGGLCSASDTVYVTVSSITGIENQGNDKKFIIYPNPAYDWIYIKTESNSNSRYDVDILDIRGKVIMSEQLKAGQIIEKISLQGIENGNYLLRLTSVKGVTTFKFVKQ